jgi:hypothetical protein
LHNRMTHSSTAVTHRCPRFLQPPLRLTTGRERRRQPHPYLPLVESSTVHSCGIPGNLQSLTIACHLGRYLTGTLSSEHLLSLFFRPSDLNLAVQIRSLIEPV